MSIIYIAKVLCCILFLSISQHIHASQAVITFVYVGETEHSAYSGVLQGLTEANLQGKFLGQKYNIQNFSSASSLPDDLSNYIAVISALSIHELLILQENIRDIPIFNLTAHDNSLRSDCPNNILSIIPSDQMNDDAIKQWDQGHPNSSVEATAWHKDFLKFAARDLNKRFRKSFDKGMDGYAWAGWATIRMVADTVARESITNPVESSISPSACISNLNANPYKLLHGWSFGTFVSLRADSKRIVCTSLCI